VKVRANAKINLTLDIVGKREDGYHLIDSVFQSVSLCDDIRVE
jgi:4-diphosphocytidyl-2-C-methyl-D-erythritol kinase